MWRSTFILTLHKVVLNVNQWRIQEFQNQGCGPGALEFLGSGYCFDTPSHILYLFVVRVENREHIVNIAFLPQLKNVCVMHYFFKRRGPSPLRRSWIRLSKCSQEFRNHLKYFILMNSNFHISKIYTDYFSLSLSLSLSQT